MQIGRFHDADELRHRQNAPIEPEHHVVFEPLFKPKDTADRWGAIDGTCQMQGTPANTADGLTAATALEHGPIVVTRNARDFARLGVQLVNPWELS